MPDGKHAAPETPHMKNKPALATYHTFSPLAEVDEFLNRQYHHGLEGSCPIMITGRHFFTAEGNYFLYARRLQVDALASVGLTNYYAQPARFPYDLPSIVAYNKYVTPSWCRCPWGGRKASNGLFRPATHYVRMADLEDLLAASHPEIRHRLIPANLETIPLKYGDDVA